MRQNNIHKCQPTPSNQINSNVSCNYKIFNIFSSHLLMIGILCTNKNYLCFMLAGLTQLVLIINFVRVMLCAIVSGSTYDFLAVRAVLQFLIFVLWWNLFLNRSQLFNLAAVLSSSNVKKQLEMKIIFSVATCSLLLCPTITFIIRKWLPYEIYTAEASCKNFWISEDYKYFQVAVEIVFYYVNYEPFFVTGLLYCTYCYLILKTSPNPPTKVKHSQECLDMWKNSQRIVRIIKTFQSIMNFPILIVLCKISMDVFSVVLMFADSSQSTYSYQIMFVISTIQMAFWFVFIVVMADLVQVRSLELLDVVFFNKRKLKLFGLNLSYFDYKEFRKNCQLTAWNIFVINRTFLLTSIATLVTYSVILAQVKDM